MQKSPRILITGANGYIGCHVVDVLIGSGIDVLVVDLSIDCVNKKARILNKDIFSGSGDIFQSLGSPDVCLHFAWKDGFAHNSPSHLENLPKHYEFIRNMVQGGLKHLAVMGSMHEIGYYEGKVDENTPCNPLNNYGIAKNKLRQYADELTKEHDTIFQWLRAFYIYGDDQRNHSVFSRIMQAESQGQKTFPFTSGKNKYDFIHVDSLAEMIAACVLQEQVTGIINCCSGVPVSLAEKVEEFIRVNNLSIKLDYGAFPDRPYDSPVIWGDDSRIRKILSNVQLNS